MWPLKPADEDTCDKRQTVEDITIMIKYMYNAQLYLSVIRFYLNG